MSPEMLKKLNKWMVYVNRTTNMAESWHRSLSATVRCQHPSYFVLIEKLMEEDEATNDFLFNRVENGMPTRPLRKKDAERRDAVYREMTSFEQEIAYRAPTKKRVAEYLEKMSCHMSTKRK
ncbi:hypothetical protein WR25_03997 [Diploscapter pachys]|uniref:Uncharacterized protein n=1 Tax=Diploscapter pachys TaxID=2018661 RepID=A0A2A2L2L4_9BILA|nr:hypothetical protein WR25_07094 [Diploscapter pachys]PAV80613.1 hypothetical protein WR25_03997 [Diploscapter pachys]